MEVQKRGHSHQRPPILPPPGFENTLTTAQDATSKTEVKP
jgi:hypothetical protein